MTTSGSAPGAVDAAGVSEGVGSQPAAGDFLVRMQDLFAEGGKQHGELLVGTGKRLPDQSSKSCALNFDAAVNLRLPTAVYLSDGSRHRSWNR